MSKIIGEYLDQICTVEIRPGKGNMPRGFIKKLYKAARKTDEDPLMYQIAKRLLDNVKEGDTVFILTGAGGAPEFPEAEVDGILGAIALARALRRGKKVNPVVLTEQHVKRPLKATCRAAGLNFIESTDEYMENSMTFIPMPINHDESEKQAKELIKTYDPSAIIAIEKLSPNSKGVIHGSTGVNFDHLHTKPQYLFEEAKKKKILTIGIGDGGNEVGFGKISDDVKSIMPNGSTCQCSCGGGSAADLSTDLLLVSAISNWGAYGLVGMLAYELDRPDIMIIPSELENMLKSCVDNGALDGLNGAPIYADDGVPLDAQLAFATMINNIIEVGLSSIDAPGH